MRKYESRPVGPSPRPSSAAISRAMRSNRSSGTRPELVLSKLLRKKVAKSDLPGRPDFVYTRAKLAVFVHGDFWHRCPACKIPLPRKHRDYWKRKLDRNVERDGLVRWELQSLGWKVVEIWEHEVKSNPRAAADRIKNVVEQINSHE